jgi:hypothetical protein
LSVFSVIKTHGHPDLLIVFLILAVWSIVLGFKGIIYHQLSDWENDEASKTITWIRSIKRTSIEKFLPRYNLGVELSVNLLAVVLIFPWCQTALFALLGYLLVESLKCSRKYVFALNRNPANNRRNVPFANNLFYDTWLPLAVTIQVAWIYPVFAWIPAVLVLLFFKEFKVLWRDGVPVLLKTLHSLKRS